MPRYGVLDHNQRDTEQPRAYYDESQVLVMLSRNQAVLLNRRLIRRSSPGSPALKAPVDTTPRAAGTCPPREVPNCYFQLPQSDAWRRAHRTVTFMQNVPCGTLGAT